MKKSLRLILCLASLLSLFFANTPTTLACSGGGDDPVALSEVIIGGWITAWKPANSGPTSQVEPVLLQISVDRVFKGTFSNQAKLQFVNYQMLDYSHAEVGWDGGLVGSCSAFEVDPKLDFVHLKTSEMQGKLAEKFRQEFFNRGLPCTPSISNFWRCSRSIAHRAFGRTPKS